MLNLGPLGLRVLPAIPDKLQGMPGSSSLGGSIGGLPSHKSVFTSSSTSPVPNKLPTQISKQLSERSRASLNAQAGHIPLSQLHKLLSL